MLRGALAFVVIVGAFVACSVQEDTTSGPKLRAPQDDGAVVDGGGSGAPSNDREAGAVEPPPSPPESDAGSGMDAATSPDESGQATYYNAEGLGSCGIQFPTDYLLCAMNDEEYKSSYCGKCLEVTGPKGKVTVRMLDKCPGCGPGDLDLSETAFSKIADMSAGRVNVTWHFVTCPF